MLYTATMFVKYDSIKLINYIVRWNLWNAILWMYVAQYNKVFFFLSKLWYGMSYWGKKMRDPLVSVCVGILVGWCDTLLYQGWILGLYLFSYTDWCIQLSAWLPWPGWMRIFTDVLMWLPNFLTFLNLPETVCQSLSWGTSCLWMTRCWRRSTTTASPRAPPSSACPPWSGPASGTTWATSCWRGRALEFTCSASTTGGALMYHKQTMAHLS